MKRVGIIGGLSAFSSADYYLRIVKLASEFLGGKKQLEVIIFSINPEEIITAVHDNDWEKAASILSKAAKKLERSGCACVVLPCNSLHKVANKVQYKIKIPILNIIDCLADFIKKKSYQNLALLGTRFTMEDGFYNRELAKTVTAKILVPCPEKREILHKIIFNELCYGLVKRKSKIFFKELCLDLIKHKKVQGVILGCTELSMLTEGVQIPADFIDSLKIHVEHIVKFALV